VVIGSVWGGLVNGRVVAIELGQLDDFEGSTTQGWVEGDSSPNPPTVVQENENGVLQNVSAGRQGAGGKMVMFNVTQWAGDYTAAGVQRIEFDARNDSGTGVPLYLRLAVSSGETAFGSTNPVVVPDDGQWYPAEFDLTSDHLTHLFGTDNLEGVLSKVSVLRIMSSKEIPSFGGDGIAGTLTVDNIRGTFIPVVADLNSDGSVDASDAGIMFAHWDGPGDGDMNHDEIVDAADAGIMFALWTGDASPVAAVWVPEPSTLAMWGAVALSFLRRRGHN
jgi:hypothetical protein